MHAVPVCNSAQNHSSRGKGGGGAEVGGEGGGGVMTRCACYASMQQTEVLGHSVLRV